MECKDCVYCYADDDGCAPCEVDDKDAEEEPELDEYD